MNAISHPELTVKWIPCPRCVNGKLYIEPWEYGNERVCINCDCRKEIKRR